MDSTIMQDFPLQTPAFVYEAVKNRFPAYRINNCIPWFETFASGFNNSNHQNGIMNFYFGYWTLQICNPQSEADVLIYGTNNPNNGNLLYAMLDPTKLDADTTEVFHNWYGFASDIVLPDYVENGKTYLLNFVGWKIDCYERRTIAAGLAIDFLIQDETGTVGFTSVNELQSDSPGNTFSVGVSQIVAQAGAYNIIASYKLPILNNANTDVLTEYSLETVGFGPCTVFSQSKQGSNWVVQVETFPGFNHIAIELGQAITVKKTADEPSNCAAVGATVYTPWTYDPNFLVAGQLLSLTQKLTGAGGVEPFVSMDAGGPIWNCDGNYTTTPTGNAC